MSSAFKDKSLSYLIIIEPAAETVPVQAEIDYDLLADKIAERMPQPNYTVAPVEATGATLFFNGFFRNFFLGFFFGRLGRFAYFRLYFFN